MVYHTPMNTKERAKLIQRAIELAYDSLDSHLQYTHKKTSEGRKFHQKCVEEYSELINILSKLY